MTAPTAQADDYCITNGAQTAHGCGYPTMETCRAASAGIGGSCSLNSSSKSSSDAKNADAKNASDAKNSRDALAYQPKQPHSRSELRSRKAPAAH